MAPQLQILRVLISLKTGEQIRAMWSKLHAGQSAIAGNAQLRVHHGL